MNLLKSSILLSSIFMISIPIGCTQKNANQTNYTSQAQTTPKSEIVSNTNKNLESKEMVWQEILPGEEAYGLKFTKNGTLSYQGVVLLPEIPVGGGSNGTAYAKKLILSPPSPSGNYHLLQGCDRLDDTALCWAEFLVNKRDKNVKKVALSKYGVQHWVQWSEDEEYALFHYTSEGASTLYGLNLKTGESTGGSDWFCRVNRYSFSWTDNRVFQIQVLDYKKDTPDWKKACKTTAYWFRGDVSVLPKY